MVGSLHVQFAGEKGVGDGVRREWFQRTVAELTDPGRGLFSSCDSGRTLLPNPHSALAGGADHLAYFTLLGRVAGFALYHREHIPAPWATSFIKAAFGYAIALGDVEAVDRALYTQKLVCIRDSVCATRDGIGTGDLELTFEAEFNADEYTAKPGMPGAPAPVQLKPGGGAIAVTEANKLEYVRLFAEHRLVGEIRPQIAAFCAGLGVFLSRRAAGRAPAVLRPG